MTPKKLHDFIMKFLDDRKAFNVVSINLSGKSSIADYMIIASGTSQRHVGSTAQILREDLKSMGYKNVGIEGMPLCDWVLVDVGDVIVHLFRPEVRQFYNLEKMWDMAEEVTKTSRTTDTSHHAAS